MLAFKGSHNWPKIEHIILKDSSRYCLIVAATPVLSANYRPYTGKKLSRYVPGDRGENPSSNIKIYLTPRFDISQKRHLKGDSGLAGSNELDF